MNDTPIKKADSFLQPIVAKAKLLEALNAKVSIYLDDAVRPFCQVGNIVGSKLVLIVANGSIATQLRFQLPDLLRKFKQEPKLASIQEIQCKVRPPQYPSKKPAAKKMPILSTDTADMIRDIAESIDDPKLKAVLIKISNHRN